MKKTTLVIILLAVFVVSCLVLTACSHTHEFGGWTVTKQATCTEAGLRERVCQCGEKETRLIPAVGHIYTSWTLIVKPTCIRKGQEQGICSCGDIAFRNITETDHTYGMWSIVEDATCTQNGQKIRTCDYCGQEQTDTIPATGHLYGNWTVVEQATCTEDGQEKRICQCGVSETRVINAKGHNYVNGKCTVCQGNSSTACTHIASDWIISTDATCTQDGSKHKVCTLCNTKLQVESIPATGHSFGTWNVVKKATCTENGQEKRTCKCGLTETRTIEATGHSFSDWTVVQKATCAVDGKEQRACTCGEKETRTIEATGHNFQQTDICKHCNDNIANVAVETYNMSATANDNVKGYVIPRTDGKYDAYLKGTGAMKDYSEGPFFVDNYPIVNAYISNNITSIGSHTFYYADLTSITIPDSITYIGSYAFYNNDGLTGISISKGVTKIDDSAFCSCSKLTSIIIEGSPEIGRYVFEYTPYYNNANNWQNKVLYINNCLIEAKTTIETCTIKDGTTVIADNAFYNCNSLTDIMIPNSVTSIGEWAFYKCLSLIDITIPSSVASIGEYAFYGCSNLASVKFDNTIGWYYTSTEGATNGTKLSLIDSAKNATYLANTYPRYCWYTNHPGHTYTATVTDPTCTESGYTTHTCNCGDKYVDNHVDALGHDYENNICTNCGWDKSESEGLEYTLSKDGTSYIVSGIGTCTDVNVVIPAQYKGKDVTTIAKSAFSRGCSKIESIKIPSTITACYDSAFSGCTSLKAVYIEDIAAWSSIFFEQMPQSNPLELAGNLYLNGKIVTNVIIPEGPTEISTKAFINCITLISIEIPDSVKRVGQNTFQGCTNLKSIKLGAGVISMWDGYSTCSSLESIYVDSIEQWLKISFINYGNPLRYADNLIVNGKVITDVVVPSSITEIKEAAFYGYTALKSITIQDNVTSIGDCAFYGCSNLDKIYFNATEMDDLRYPGHNIFYNAGKNRDGIKVVIGNNVTKIPAYLFNGLSKITGVEFEAGSVCKSIGNYAFTNCSGIKSITIPSNVISIGNYAFESCTGLTSVTVSASLTTVGDYAFYGCSNIEKVFYAGTESQWKRIKFGSINGYLYNSNIIYNYTGE